jgi:hypothetical protein
MTICAEHIGAIEEYEGICRVLVTAQEMGENEFYALKLAMLRRGVELISVHHGDSVIDEFVAFMAHQKQPSPGRRKFGDKSPEEMAVVRRIFALRDGGYTLKEISEDAQVHHMDGRRMTVSSIQGILRNRDKY